MLTDKAATQAKPKEKLYRLSDGTGNGLSLEVSPEGGKSEAQITAFEDTWHWGEQAEMEFKDILQSGRTDVAEMTQALRKFLGENDMMAYLIMMTNRLIELQRVLKDTGSLYLHCDPTASHYLKIVLDGVFGKKNFRNEIIWRYQTGGVSKRWFGRKHDIIFWYTKTDQYAFYPDAVRVPRTKEVLRRISSGVIGATRATTLDKYPDDVFEIQALNAQAKERLGYPTQKPLALLERIIQASSNEGDTVLDP